MINKEYREIVKIALDLQEYLISILTEEYHESIKHRTWLQLIGLIETQDIARGR